MLIPVRRTHAVTYGITQGFAGTITVGQLTTLLMEGDGVIIDLVARAIGPAAHDAHGDANRLRGRRDFTIEDDTILKRKGP